MDKPSQVSLAESLAFQMEFHLVVNQSLEFDGKLLTMPSTRFAFFKERCQLALAEYREMTDPKGLGYTHRKAMDFLPLRIRAKLDGIPLQMPSAEAGWVPDTARTIPGTDVKL